MVDDEGITYELDESQNKIDTICWYVEELKIFGLPLLPKLSECQDKIEIR